jgi:V8-like Glu-specific endopeptidase
MSVVLALCTCSAFAAHNPVVATAHKATHVIVVSGTPGDKEGRSVCSATAIGPHALLTATHCTFISDNIEVDGIDMEVVYTLGDGHDHTIIFLKGDAFGAFAAVVGIKGAEQGDPIFVIGNPRGMMDMYRSGSVSGIDQEKEIGLETYFDFNGFHGDSGAAVFNAEGNIIAVVNFLMSKGEGTTTYKLVGAFDMHFSAEQLKQASTYVCDPEAK